MSKKRKERLLLNLLEGQKQKHRVAMVNEEGAFNQHEPNSNMARMFVVMLLIHVVVIGGIIIYDWVNGEEAAPGTATTQPYKSTVTPSALPTPAVNAAGLDKEMPIEEYATYEWRSGDSIPSVAKKLDVSEEVLIRLNMLDKGTQLDQNSILRYPKRPVLKAVGVSVAGAHGEAPQPVPGAGKAGITAAETPMNLTAPAEQTFSFKSNIAEELTPTPKVVALPMVQDAPPAAETKEATGTPKAREFVAEVKKETPKVADAPPEKKAEPKQVEKAVPKAIPVPRPAEKNVAKKTPEAPAPKKIADSPPEKKATPAAPKSSRPGSHVVKSGDTMYSIALKNGISVKALQAANKSARPEALRDGMTLVLPGK